MSLPQFVVMRSVVSGKYLCYGKKKASTLSSSLAFSHEAKRLDLDVVAREALESLKKKITSLDKVSLEFRLIKFEVQEAKNAPGFVHIRTCYNNKYLTRQSEKSKSLVAEAHEVEEDQLKWSCTLFKPIFHGEAKEGEGRDCVFGSNKHGIGMRPQSIQLMHVAMGEEYYVSESMELIKKESLENITTKFTVSDVTSSAQLPKYVTFKCHDGSKYLGSPDWFGLDFVFFDMADEQGVAMVNLNAESGPADVAIFCGNSQNEGGYWTPDGDSHICLTYSSTWVYTPVKINNYVALYSYYDHKFLQRDPNNNDCLSTLSANINEEAQFQVGEPVLSRTILNITYDIHNARVYGTSADVTKITDSRSNYTDHQDTGSLSRDFTMSRTMTWNQSITVSIGMSVTIKFGTPEVRIGEEVHLNFDISETTSWGEENTKTETIKHTYNFDVPKHTKQTKSVVASRSFCDVPFTCEVEDLLVDGTKHRYIITDCLFTGANDYDANEETHEQPLPA